MGQPTIHEGRMWLDKQGNPWFGVQVTKGRQVTAEVQIKNNPDPNDVPIGYFTIDYRLATTTEHKVTETEHGVTVNWANNSGKETYLRVSLGYVPDDERAASGYKFASRKFHISIATPDKRAVDADMGDMAMMHGLSAMDELDSLLAELTFDVAKIWWVKDEVRVAVPAGGGAPDWPEPGSAAPANLKMLRFNGTDWVEAPEQVWQPENRSVSIGSIAANKKMLAGMYILGIPV